MISIKKDFASIPGLLASPLRNKLILESLVAKNKHAFDSKVYRDATLSALDDLYKSKCAYCETDTSAGAPMQVEHYRPKAKVTDDLSHSGYYWIAYEWSNLILSCSKCNNKKRNKFPVLGKRVTHPLLGLDGFPSLESVIANSTSFMQEQALIIHPEIDKVEDHFIFNEMGEIVGRTDRAIVTIQICNLNRKELIFKRLAILKGFTNDIKEILAKFLSKEITHDQCRYAIKLVFSKIAGVQSPENQYSRFGFFLFNKFDLFVASALEGKQREAIRILFTQFIEGTL